MLLRSAARDARTLRDGERHGAAVWKNDFGGFRNVLPPEFRAIGAITQPLIESVNRPTFQQADEILGHGPR